MEHTTTQQAEQPVVQSFVDERFLPLLEERFLRINKQCAKLGVPNCRYELTGKEELKTFQDIATGRRYVKRSVEVAVYGQAPKLAGGWQLAAAMDLSLDVPLVLEVPGKQVDTRVRERGNVCDHCGKRRSRSQVFVLHNEQGEQKLVGRQCLADFLGSHGTDPAATLWGFLSLGSVLVYDEDKLPRGTPRAALEDLLAITAAIVDGFGWASKSAVLAGHAKYSTSTLASFWFFPPFNPQDELKETLRLLEAACKGANERAAQSGEVAAALEWARTLQPTNAFEGNLQALANNASIAETHFPIACWILVGYRKHLGQLKQRESERVAGAASQYVGELKKRMDAVLELRDARTIDTNFGTSYLCKFVDASGNQLTWFATSSPRSNGWAVGDKALARFTVKKHEEYKGTRTTLVNRVVRLDVPSTTN